MGVGWGWHIRMAYMECVGLYNVHHVVHIFPSRRITPSRSGEIRVMCALCSQGSDKASDPDRCDRRSIPSFGRRNPCHLSSDPIGVRWRFVCCRWCPAVPSLAFSPSWPVGQRTDFFGHGFFQSKALETYQSAVNGSEESLETYQRISCIRRWHSAGNCSHKSLMQIFLPFCPCFGTRRNTQPSNQGF